MVNIYWNNFLCWYSNSIERKYIINKDIKSKELYRSIIIIIFSILVIIYYYFYKDSYKDVLTLSPSDSKKKSDLTKLSCFGSLLVLLSGIIFLFIAIVDEEIDIELAFN